MFVVKFIFKYYDLPSLHSALNLLVLNTGANIIVASLTNRLCGNVANTLTVMCKFHLRCRNSRYVNLLNILVFMVFYLVLCRFYQAHLN